MRRYFTAALLFLVKFFARTLYRIETVYLGGATRADWTGTRLILLLNHTSLFEPLFLGELPNWLLWKLADHLIAPGADKTLNRPILGRFYRLLAPQMVSITRKRDRSWSDFLGMIDPEAIVLLLPEGRMKRRNGLDASGKPMSIRGGVADVLQALSDGKMAIAYSGGLHHVQAPGDTVPRLFKTIRANVEFLDILTYKQEIGASSRHEFKLKVVDDLEERLSKNTPIPLPE